MAPWRFRDCGSIPAYAGKPCRPSSSGRSPSVYPRPRGEATCPSDRFLKSMGPSPPTRGSPVLNHGVVVRDGSIPAYAGKPGCSRLVYGQEKIHPPPTRGSREGRIAEDGIGRSIPAHAGKPGSRRAWCRRCRVHPAPRGEALFYEDTYLDLRGPSPPTRGSLESDGVLEEVFGSIPAHAGKPLTIRKPKGSSKVHPRPRGEAVTSEIMMAPVNGPSPPTRGSLRQHLLDGSPPGSIPAHAGKPLVTNDKITYGFELRWM